MTGDEVQARRAHELARQAQRNIDRAVAAQSDSLRLAEVIAATEDDVAATMDQLAEERPDRAAHFRALGEAAREYAAKERRWVKEHRSGRLPEDPRSGRLPEDPGSGRFPKDPGSGRRPEDPR